VGLTRRRGAHRGQKIKCRVTCSPLIAAGQQREGVILMMEEAAG
jgi:hypothetical protein